ncbi:hypothetical protein WG68_14415 [Arsukibacterium ikkense]|uniref:DUF4878 domain-containing protein n=1 Tax=Arsukibacterium ikkense TaxID=336831 RepID=A0A0M2V1K8_9GAMM|nr:hypothetical protein [Arsukibacterium ikkense]KKO44732.1 hypothetical protein WG68_14415 [Arsukibacterium ikkense]
MKYIVSVAAILALLGCAATKPVSLYQTYTDYSSQINAENVEQLAPAYFSSSLLPKSFNDSSVTQQLLFKNMMAEQLQHAELITGNTGCLALAGQDSEQQPLQFNLAYRSENDKWLINQVHVVFLEQLTELKPITNCAELFPR